MALDENKVITIDNINTLAEAVSSIGDGDYIYIYKATSQSFSRIEKSVFLQWVNGNSNSGGIDASIYSAICRNVDTVQQAVDELIEALAGIAFNSLPKPNLIGELTWPSADSAIPVLTSPSVSSIDVGTSNADTRTTTFLLKGSNLTKPISLSVVGTGFSVSPASVSAANANSGVTITITHTDTSITGGSASGTLTIASDDGVSKNISLTARKGASVETRVNVTVTLTGCTLNGVSDGNAGTAPMNGSFSGMLVAASGYQLPITSIVVTMGGQNVSFDSGSGNTFNATTGEFSIGTVTGAIEITATATVESQEYVVPTIKVRKNYFYSILNSNLSLRELTGATSNIKPTTDIGSETNSVGGENAYTLCASEPIDLPITTQSKILWSPKAVMVGTSTVACIAFFDGETYLGRSTANQSSDGTPKEITINNITGLSDAIAAGTAKARMTFLMSNDNNESIPVGCGLWYGSATSGNEIWVPEVNGVKKYNVTDDVTL